MGWREVFRSPFTALDVKSVPPIEVSVVMDRTFEAMIKYGTHKEFSPVEVMVADDSDDHRTRTGGMQYSRAVIIAPSPETDCRGSSWVVARGKPTGYITRDFEGDMLLTPFDEDIETSLHHNTGFRNSAFISMRDGTLRICTDSHHAQMLGKSLRETMRNYVEGAPYTERAGYNTYILNSSRGKYSPDLPEHLSQYMLMAIRLYQRLEPTD